ncbi:hypothetical protein SAMN05216404_1412 [Nitrosospira multiformis]|uniref:Uncharacterized protein n=1 Tax=Nitrosospira multiformis TaxID=1231 RepID=A0A1H8QK01_9PROT|nr:hypothetical protein [Nitrosospira multiformis]SEO54257.1 hypothetical protein SAMN05216404_1412 [Nitrosospira multiformis]
MRNYRSYYRDSTSELKVIGGPPKEQEQEQAETLVGLEAKEAKGKVETQDV